VWRSRGIVADLARDGVEVFHGLSAEIPLGLRAASIRSVVTVHDLIFERLPELYGAVDRRIYRWKAKSAAARADLIVAISAQTRRDLVELYGVPAERIRVVYQGCHAAFRRDVPPEALDAVLREYALSRPFVLQVGTIEPRKNLLSTVRAVAGIPGVNLVAVGRETEYASQVRAEVERLGLSERVRILSGVPTEKLAALYRCAVAAAYPSRYEGFGIPILEALCSGTPVVTTRGGCFEEAGGPGSAYVGAEDPGELRDVLAAVVRDPARQAAMREAGLAHAERFRDEVIARDLAHVYEEARRA
jgi:glycosyltransferase involved in cell wall biosynthesis